jgi:hypothetical protein
LDGGPKRTASTGKSMPGDTGDFIQDWPQRP